MNYIDIVTGRRYPSEVPRWQSDDGNGVDLEPCPGITRDRIDPSRRSLWRYAAAMAVPFEGAVTLGEGWTPLLPRAWQGVDLLWKLEYVMPTGSFKDRGMTAMVSYLKQHGITDVLEDSSGNAGASLSTYAAAAGMRCRIMVPASASYPKIAQMAAHGADVVAVSGTRQDVADAALREASSMFYASHNRQPYFLEGTKTLAYELGPAGILVNAIAPGLIKTRFSSALVDNAEINDRVVSRTPLGRVGAPEEIVGGAVFLASDSSSFVTGHTLVIDGGLTLATI